MRLGTLASRHPPASPTGVMRLPAACRDCISLLHSWQKPRFLPAETKLMSEKAPQATFSNELVRWRSRSTGALRRSGARIGMLHAGEGRPGMAFGCHRRVARARVLLCLEMLLGARDGGLRGIEIGGRAFRRTGAAGSGDSLSRVAHFLHGGAAAAHQA